MPNPRPVDLVPFSVAKEVHADDTLREMRQVFRFTFIDMKDEPLRAQIIFDRVHKQDARLSKPAGFFPVSETEELIRLGKNSITSATILACFQNAHVPPDRGVIRKAVHSVLEQIENDIVLNATIMLGEIDLHRRSRL